MNGDRDHHQSMTALWLGRDSVLQVLLSAAVCRASCRRSCRYDWVWSHHLAGARPLRLFPSTLPIKMCFSRDSGPLRAICPRNFSMRDRQISDRRTEILSSFRIDSFRLKAVHGMRNILRQIHISNASILVFRLALIVHVSEPYKKIGKTSAWTSLTLVRLVIFVFFHIFSSLVMALLAIWIRLLISLSQFPSLVMRDPR
ncbi:hypothetical protein JYU34_012429 [Plutella xylostella]|uniref:Uncharacterized protein n=1 Tax=Plutella xylostella TaxID=51655 RepID=A0ABQ7QBC9_PLUXY|nr:hypothetical protein JYU34_012429 [Plutella xylostella]